MEELQRFLNLVKSLHNIDGDQLPELDRVIDWPNFRDDPVRFFIRAADGQQAAIWREIEKRQNDTPLRSLDRWVRYWRNWGVEALTDFLSHEARQVAEILAERK